MVFARWDLGVQGLISGRHLALLHSKGSATCLSALLPAAEKLDMLD